MRLFIGVELDDALKAAIAAEIDRIRREIERRRARVQARWVPPENHHITLWFLGEVDDSRAASVAKALERPFETPAFTLRISGAGTFPPSGAPRVIWMGIAEGSPSLRSLHEDLATRLAPLGFEREARAYSPHLTIARVKEGPPALRDTLRAAVGDVGACTVGAVTLFRSRTSPKGATYEALFRVALPGEG